MSKPLAPKFEVFEVGGAVRDDLLGLPSKDVDFVVVGPESFEAMVAELKARGFKVFLESPEFVTVRAKVPASMPELAARTDVADFVLARKDGPSSDGRRPDFVEPGTLEDDLRRRDFTVNAMARGLDGALVDPFGGEADLAAGVLRFVGEPMDRLREDGLRMLRGFRFMVVKGLEAEPATMAALASPEARDLLRSVSRERVREEVEKMLKASVEASLALFARLPAETVEVVLEGFDFVGAMKRLPPAEAEKLFRLALAAS